MARPRKGLSYVLGDASEKENHILPVNCMQFSNTRQQLYTAGRDGTVKVWSAKTETPGSEFDFSVGANSFPEEQQDVAETILKLETSLSSSPLRYTQPKSTYDPRITKSYNVHFDWVNDLKLVNNGRHLVSASADLSLKLIDIDGDERHVQKFQNIHTDYVKKISSIPSQSSLVSGGLDGKVVIWDMSRLCPVSSFENNSTGLNLTTSIYALSNDDGYLISTGGPNNTINLYDRRISSDANANLIRKLVGHQDNVRCLLMNSNYILSGSSDSTIKLWDLRNFNVYKNIDVHDDAVWALGTSASSDPCSNSTSASGFKEFYSGDKAGTIIKTDLSYLSTQSGATEDDPFFQATFSSSDQLYIDEKIGLCTLVAKTPSPIVSLCVEGQDSIIASCYDSLKRFYIPETKSLSNYQYLRTCMDYSESLEKKYDDDSGQGLDSPTAQSDLDSDFYDIISHLSTDSAKFDITSSFSTASRAPPPMRQESNTLDLQTQYTSMFLSVSGGPSSEYVNAYKDELGTQPSAQTKNEFVDETPMEMLLNPIPPDQIVTVPFNKRPFQEFHITPKSIVSKKMLNNKRHLISLYVNGDIKIWDVFTCKIIRFIPYKDGARRLSDEELKMRSNEFDSFYQQYQSKEVLTNWCEVYIRSGKLLVTLSESYAGNVEIYYDELVRDYPFLEADYEVSQRSKIGAKKSPIVSNDTRFWIARIFLASIFQQYCAYEWKSDEMLRENMKNYKPKPKQNNDPTDVEDMSKRKRLFSRVSSTIPRAKAGESFSSASGTNADEGIVGYDCKRLPSSVPDDSIAKSLAFNEHLYKEKYSVQGQKRMVDSLLKLYIDVGKSNEEDEDDYRPLIPIDHFPEDVLIIIYETSAELGNLRDLCSFHLGDMKQFEHCDITLENQLVNQLRINIPKWIGTAILYNKFTAKEQPKISFQVFEIDYESLPAHKKIGGKSQKKIKKLPAIESSIKLSSHCMLRVSKILHFLTEKFETRTTEMKMKKPATEWLQLECKGQELDDTMTLQTIKTLIWKSSTDIELYFHRKFD